MIKGYNAEQNAARARARAAAEQASIDKAKKRGRPRKTPAPIPPPNPMPPVQQAAGFPILIPEQLRTCLMARDDVEVVVKRAVQEVMDHFELKNAQRKVYLSEAMERLGVKSRSTMWHWHEKGYLRQEKDDNKHVYYLEYKIRRAERGEQPEGGQDDEN